MSRFLDAGLLRHHYWDFLDDSRALNLLPVSWLIDAIGESWEWLARAKSYLRSLTIIRLLQPFHLRNPWIIDRRLRGALKT